MEEVKKCETCKYYGPEFRTCSHKDTVEFCELETCDIYSSITACGPSRKLWTKKVSTGQKLWNWYRGLFDENNSD